MTWSLNEYEALARKAARGVGMSWGQAEEVGKAARRLEELGVHASGQLAALLERNDGRSLDSLCPDALDLPWRATGGLLCPIAAGTCQPALLHSPLPPPPALPHRPWLSEPAPPQLPRCQPAAHPPLP